MNAIADVQSSRDLRNLPINQVGIKDLRFPISLKSKEGEQSTVARLTMTVFLPADQKGTHMSRFVALMEKQTDALDFDTLHKLTADMVACWIRIPAKSAFPSRFSARKMRLFPASNLFSTMMLP